MRSASLPDTSIVPVPKQIEIGQNWRLLDEEKPTEAGDASIGLVHLMPLGGEPFVSTDPADTVDPIAFECAPLGHG